MPKIAFEGNQSVDWELWRRQYRERAEPILKRICNALEIEHDIAKLGLRPVPEYADMFPNTQFFFVEGIGFERPLLPSSSFMYCALNRDTPDVPFVELTPRNMALNDLLSRNWDLLPQLSPKQLADFVLTMITVGTTYHEVLVRVQDLESKSRRKQGFVMNDTCRGLMKDSSLSTTIEVCPQQISIHALTLFGWMHEKQNLGVTRIKIDRSGVIQTDDRETICDPVFSEIPGIWY